jgi:hypothetical protein
MLHRGTVRVVGVLALLALAGWVLGAEEAVFDNCTVVSAGGGKLTVVGPDGGEHSVPVAADAAITLNGKPCKLEDLKKDARAKLTVRKGDGKAEVLKVEATTR